jgi:HAMP domain-containing protein
MTPTPTRVRHSLILKLVGVSILLLLIVQAAGFAVVHVGIDRNARLQLARELDNDERVWLRLLEQNAERLRQGSALLAADYGFRAAVSSDDQPTIQSALENHGARIGAAATALLDTRLALRAASLASELPQMPAELPLVVQALAAQPQGSQVAVIAGRPYQFVMVPLRAPLVIGWVLMGFPVGQPLADEMRQLLGVDVAVRVQAGASTTLPVATVPAPVRARLLQPGALPLELQAGTHTLLVRARALPAVGGEVHTLLLRSVDTVVGPLRQLQLLLAAITAAGVLLFALGNGAMAQRLTTPLRSLLTATRRLAGGDYSEPLRHTGRSDEIGDLARSFDGMRLEIARQQAEVRDLAYRDRLTGLPNRERFRQAVMQAIAAQPPPGEHTPGSAAAGSGPFQACQRRAGLRLWRPPAAGRGPAPAAPRIPGPRSGGTCGRQRICAAAARCRPHPRPEGCADHRAGL